MLQSGLLENITDYYKIIIMKKIALTLLFLGQIITAQEWQTDFKTAQSIASETNKNILLVFSGSDWCAPCIKLDREVWATEEFIDFSSKMVLLKADFPKRKANKLSDEQQEKNNLLAEKFNTEGNFPLVVVLNSEGNVLYKTGYNKIGAAGYIALLKQYAN